jgi:hypothetical protein
MSLESEKGFQVKHNNVIVGKKILLLNYDIIEVLIKSTYIQY